MYSRPHKYKLHIGVYIIILSNKTSLSHNCLNLMELPRAKLSFVESFRSWKITVQNIDKQ